MNEYTDNGYKNRREYLDSLSEDMGIDRDTVFALAGMLGPSEDFDGLITMLEDMEGAE